MLVKETVIIKKKTADAEKSKELINKMRKEHDKLVLGKFEFIDAQGGFLDFCYKIFPNENIKTYRLHHGEEVEIPLGMVKHINNTVKKVRKYHHDEPSKAALIEGRGVPSTYEVQSRCRFTPKDML